MLTIQEIIDIFGSRKEMYTKLGVSKVALSNMERKNYIPPAKAIEIHNMDIDIHIDQIPVKS